MRVVDIIPGTTVDGPGMRTSIYFAGCRHQCPGCHNPATWDFSAGREMSVPELMDIIIDNDFDVTFTGGDPLFSAKEIIPLAKAIRQAGYSIWVYTGFIFEDVMKQGGAESRLLSMAEAVVDGPFIEALRDTSLHFRGSSNQRIIDVAATVATGNTVTLFNDLNTEDI